MPQPGLDRRHAALTVLAAALWPVAARADLGLRILPVGLTSPGAPGSDVGLFTDLYRRMTAPVTIDGAGPFEFVVDTGANRSVASAELVSQLGLALGPEEPVNDAAGVTIAPTVAAKLAIGSRAEALLTLSVLPAEAIGGEGMLGLDRLADQRLTLDFKGKRIWIEGGRGGGDAGAVVVPARRRFGQLTVVDADLEGVAITAFLDSGSQSTIGNPALEAIARDREARDIWTAATIESASGQTIPAQLASLASLRVGGLWLRNLPVAFADLHTFRLWGLTSRPAILLGVDVLSRFDSVELDFARGEVRFRLPA
jgi:hypothetical protein